MLRKLRRSCRITRKSNPHLMIALTLMLMLGNLMAPIASTIEAAPASQSSSQSSELTASQADTTLSQTLQPLQPIDRGQAGDDEDQNQDEDTDVDEPTTPEGRPAGINVNLYWCDESVDLTNAPANDYAMGESLKTDCDAQAAPITVRITSNTNSSNAMETTVNQFPGIAEFSPVNPDDWTINVMPKVVVTKDLFNCNGLTPYGNTKPYSTYARIAPDKSQYDMDLLSEEVVTCDWFGQVPDTNSLNITKWNCPEAFDFATQGYEVAKQTCWDDVNPPVEFTVKSIEPNVTFEQTQATDPNNNDETYFSEIPEGAFELSEQVPDGYGLIAIYCSLNQRPAVETLLSAENMIRVEATGGNAIRCDVFDQPGANSGTMGRPSDDTPSGVSLTIYKWECLADTDPANNDHSYFGGQCESEKAGVPFQIIDANGSQDITSDTNGKQVDGLVPDADGLITIVEGQVSGYLPPVAFCHELNDELSQQMRVVDRGIAVRPSSGDVQIQCFFYNIPSTSTSSGVGDVIIYKLACPADVPVPADADLTWLVANCGTMRNDVTFVLDRPEPDADIQTNTGDRGQAWKGIAVMEGVEAGTYPLTETYDPDGYTLLAAYCSVVDRGADTPSGGWQQATLSGTSTDITVTSDKAIHCVFFNALTSTGQGAVKLWKWDCGNAFITDSSADANDPNWLSTNCTTPQSVEFDLDGFPLTTNNGYVDWVGVTPGTYSLTEHVPDGYAPVAVVCVNEANGAEISNMIEGGVTTPVSGAISITVEADHSTNCNWYNKPVGSGEIQIKKWDCGDAVLPQKADYTWFATNCTTKQDGVTFTVNTTPPLSATTVDGFASIKDVPEGDYQLSEQIPDGYAAPAVACTLVSKDVSVENLSFALVPKTQGTNNSVDIKMLADHIVYCNWFNMPKHDGDFSLTIYKWQCPVGTDVSSTDPDYFSGECATQMAEVPFHITDGNTTVDTTSDIDGRQIDNLVPDADGNISITEDIPSGYTTPVVFCSALNAEEETQYPVSAGNAVVAAPVDDDLHCFWYNIPDPGNTVHVTKWECPEGTAQDATIEWLQNNCMTRLSGVDFSLTTSAGTTTQTTDMDGETRFAPVPSGTFTLSESIPTGYSPYPIVVCSGTVYFNGAIGDMFPNVVSAPGGSWTFNASDGQWTIHCDFYNIPQTPSTIIIYKWSCPDDPILKEGFHSAEEAMNWHQTNCVTPMDGIEFTLTDTIGPRTATTAAGQVSFADVATGPVQLKETIPSGYSNQPFLVCQEVHSDGSTTPWYWATTTNGVYNTSITNPGTEIICHWYNHQVGPGEITVYKWTCPEGYDRTAWGADPTIDCVVVTNGVTFKLSSPVLAVDLMSDTGDSVPGAVYFGGLEPGHYTLDEMVGLDTLKDVFIWQCYGLTTSSVQPTPLNVGSRFEFDIVGGDQIYCFWYNVPKTPHGWLDVTKFNCTTEKYVADVYCYTNQTGQEFNLQKWDGANWNTIASGITDVNGKLSFPNLDEGDYRLVEPNKEACLIKSSNITTNKNIGVKNGEGTTVYVYNCKTPPPPNDKPGKYPNTGVAPDASTTQERRMPGIELAGLIGLAGMSMNRRRFLKRAAGVTLGAGALALPAVAAQDLVSLDSTPVPATPGANVLGCGTPAVIGPDEGTPGPGTPVWEDPCTRGAIPLRFRVPIIGVDAHVEYLEIIDGQMQPPSGAEDVTWYKETSRLGEVGNGIYAGHLNYWGIPEGVFFRLESLQEGDVIEIDGDDAQTYIYVVQWMQNFPSDEEPPEEALGTTNEKAITVITCGGEWVSARAEYDHRTLVRAVLQEDQA